MALFLPAVLTMCSEALMNLTWMKLGHLIPAWIKIELPFLLHKAANNALQGATLRLHHYHCLNIIMVVILGKKNYEGWDGHKFETDRLCS